MSVKERISNVTNGFLDGSVLNITPEKYYDEKLRPQLQKVRETVKFDVIMIETVELAMNRADGCTVRKDYIGMRESFEVLSNVLLSSNSTYRKSDGYRHASNIEQECIETLSKCIQDFIMIVNSSMSVKQEEVPAPKIKERIGYDEKTKQNII